MMVHFIPFLILFGSSLIIGKIHFNYLESNQNQLSLSTPLSMDSNRLCGISLQVSNGNDRIVGGRVALDGEFPWQVSIRRYSSIESDFVHICGGSIISDQWILTAAHCVHGVSANNFRIVANITKLSEAIDYHLVHNVSHIFTHPNFDEETNINDISLIKLASPLDLQKSNGHMGIICLPRFESKEPGLLNNRESVDFVTVTGWGTTDEEGDNSMNLLAADVALVETDKCNSTYRGDVAEGFICAGLIEGGKDSCQGDSGGPMIHRDSDNKAQLVGIVSWGEGCGRKAIPGVYVDVKYHLNWIYSVMYSN